MKILDFGCGDGIYKELLENNRLKRGVWIQEHPGPETWGIDIDPIRIERLRQCVNSGTNLISVDGGRLPFESAFFDLVHCGFVLHHMSYPRKGIQEIKRVLKPGGTLILSEAVDNNLIYRIARRIKGKWRGSKINSYFTSYELWDNLKKDFELIDEKFYWRSIIGDILALNQIEPWISLKIHDWISETLMYNKLGEYACCHYVIEAKRK